MAFREGTRSYAFFQKLSVTGTSAQSSALTECEEVLLCATKAMWVTVGSDPTATTSNSIPLIAGEKFHLRVRPGYKIAAIRDSENGDLVICRSN